MPTPELGFDVLVLGAGPGGSATAMLLARQGLRVGLVEREAFPRFHIGESLTGTAGDFITRHALEPQMAAFDFPAKSGVRVFGRDPSRDFHVPVLRPTWQVRRAEFDDLLVSEAEAAGVERIRGRAVAVLSRDGRVHGLVVDTDEAARVELHASFVVDASGQHTFLSKQGVAGSREVDLFGRQVASYAHYTGVRGSNNETTIYYAGPLEWAWQIPISSEVASIGVVLPAQTYKQHGGTLDGVMRWGLRHLHPTLADRCTLAEPQTEVRASRNYSYRVDPFVGPGWLCVGDAHGFVDPIFSFGVSFALTEAEAAAAAITSLLADPAREAKALLDYARFCGRGQDRAADLIHYFWRFPAFFSYMTRGPHGGDIVRLLAGDCFSVEPLPASQVMREALAAVPASPSPRRTPARVDQ